MSRILVVGGAGYIGSHMMIALTKAGHDRSRSTTSRPGTRTR